jgi:hypothetical protein
LNSWLCREMFFFFFSMWCIDSITFCLQVPHMDWNIDSSLPLENLNCIIVVFIVLFWQMEFVLLFQCQILVWSVIPNACVVIWNALVITMDVIPLVFAHFANSWSLGVCDCL